MFGGLGVLCVLLGLYVLYALCTLYAFSKPYVQHRWPQGAPPARDLQMVDKGIWMPWACLNVLHVRAFQHVGAAGQIHAWTISCFEQRPCTATDW